MKFVPDPTFDAKMRLEPELQREIKRQAGGVQRLAETFAEAKGAPWMPRKGNPGRIFIVEDGPGGTAYVVNLEHGGHLVEFGSKNNPPHSPLRRAVRAVGLRLRELPKP